MRRRYLEKPVSQLKIRPKVLDWVYSDRTWGRDFDKDRIVGIITDVRSKDFDFIALKDVGNLIWCERANMKLVDGITTTTDTNIAYLDFYGKSATATIIEAMGQGKAPAAEACASYATEGFPAGEWYLPSAGQFNVLSQNRTDLQEELGVYFEAIKDGDYTYFTSTQRTSNYAWYADIYGGLAGQAKYGGSYVRPFCTLEYNPISDGVYICDNQNKYYAASEWVSAGRSASDAIGIVVSYGIVSFMLSLEETDLVWGTANASVSRVPKITNSGDAVVDYRGRWNTPIIVKTYGNSGNYAAKYCQDYVFGNGQVGYLPGLGELHTTNFYANYIENCMDVLGAEYFDGQYWSSTQYSNTQHWTENSSNAQKYESYDTQHHVRAFALAPFKDNLEK